MVSQRAHPHCRFEIGPKNMHQRQAVTCACSLVLSRTGHFPKLDVINAQHVSSTSLRLRCFQLGLVPCFLCCCLSSLLRSLWCQCWLHPYTLVRMAKIIPPQMALYPPPRLQIRQPQHDAPILVPIVSLLLDSRRPPMSQAVSTGGGVILPQSMLSWGLATRSLLVSLFSSTR